MEMEMNVTEVIRGENTLELPLFPPRMKDHVAFDKSSVSLFVTRELRSDPLLLTWLHQVNEITGPSKRIYVVVSQIDEIAQMRSRGMVLDGDPGKPKDDAKVKQATLALIQRAAVLGASDLHLLLKGSHAEAQVRVKGGLFVLDRMTQDEGEAFSRALFQGIATVKDANYNPMEFQNAQISGEEIARMGLTSIRLVRGPAFPVDDGGGFVVMRLQYDSSREQAKSVKPFLVLERPKKPDGKLRLSEMGYSDWQVERLKFLARCPNGLIVFTGPTGTGKTTTLYEMLKHVARERSEDRLVTIEDPVEYPMSWAIQLVVSNVVGEEATGAAFTSRLRAALRMDPDIILMGELRGADSAVAAFDAALTGHQVWTTLHTTDPYKTIGRLELLDGVRLARGFTCDHTTLRGMIAQRLVPLLCSQCSVPIQKEDYPDSLISALATHGDIGKVRMRGQGCTECHGDAVTGRVAVSEVVVTDARLMRDFIDHGVETARKNHRARSDTDDSMMMHAIQMVLDGKLDPRDVEEEVDVILPLGRED